MKILAFSDAHMNAEFIHEVAASSIAADVVVGAGDFANRGGSALSIMDILVEIAKPVIIVSGNHDNLLELTRSDEAFENIHLLHGSGVKINGVNFYGLGCEVPKRNDADWNEWLSEEAAAKMLEACTERSVLITHSPAFGHCDLQIYGANEGSRAVLECVRKKTPKLHLCGHIHNAWGVSSKIGDTPTHNLGPSINWFEV